MSLQAASSLFGYCCLNDAGCQQREKSPRIGVTIQAMRKVVSQCFFQQLIYGHEFKEASLLKEWVRVCTCRRSYVGCRAGDAFAESWTGQ